MKPLLAGKIGDPTKLNFPVLATPKIDGIRCLTFEGGEAKSRKLKPIPNAHIRQQLALFGIEGLDGELVIPGAKDFGTTSSAVMRESGKPAFEYHVFDLWDGEGGYVDRLKTLSVLAGHAPAWLKILLPVQIDNIDELYAYEHQCLSAGYEGVMVRTPNGPYKHGRSSTNQQILLKMKRFLDSEAEIIGFVEELHNANEAKVDALGHTERSSHKGNKVPKGCLGKLRVRDLKTGVEFGIGTGLGEPTPAHGHGGEVQVSSFRSKGRREA
jgi:DNA ligase-1